MRVCVRAAAASLGRAGFAAGFASAAFAAFAAFAASEFVAATSVGSSPAVAWCGGGLVLTRCDEAAICQAPATSPTWPTHVKAPQGGAAFLALGAGFVGGLVLTRSPSAAAAGRTVPAAVRPGMGIAHGVAGHLSRGRPLVGWHQADRLLGQGAVVSAAEVGRLVASTCAPLRRRGCRWRRHARAHKGGARRI
jgi:hypothetical protein